MDEFYVDNRLYGGRPLSSAGREEVELRCYDLLDELEIFYLRADHAQAATIEACHGVEQVLGAKICKNLFLCNRQKTQFYLLLLPGDKVFKTKYLSAQLGCARLSFGDGADMERTLSVTPGSASVLSLMNDKAGVVQLLMDREIFEAPELACHPCKNTSTLRLRTEDILKRFLPHVNHAPIVVDLPEEEPT